MSKRNAGEPSHVVEPEPIDLATLVSDPTRLDDVTAEHAAHLITEIDYVVPYLQHVRTALWERVRAQQTSANERRGSSNGREPDRLLDAKEAAERLSMSTSALYRIAHDAPFTKRLPNGRLRFSSRGLAKWIESRPR